MREIYSYQIDNNDRIVSVSSNWCSFAKANDSVVSQNLETVLGHELWEFIQDIETRHLYKEVLKRARCGVHAGNIPFRCDSPTERRYLELQIDVLPDKSINFSSIILRVEPRHPISLLDIKTPRSTEFVTICSMCKKLKVAADKWLEIEDGLKYLRLFETEKMPQLTHGICGGCYQKVMGELEALNENRSKTGCTVKD